jgi:hypothetical protein
MIQWLLPLGAISGVVVFAFIRKRKCHSQRIIFLGSTQVHINTWDFGTIHWPDSIWWSFLWTIYLSYSGQGHSGFLVTLLSFPLNIEWIITHSNAIYGKTTRLTCILVCLSLRYALVSILHPTYSSLIGFITRSSAGSQGEIPWLIDVGDRFAPHLLVLHYTITSQIVRRKLDRYILKACLSHEYNTDAVQRHPLAGLDKLKLLAHAGDRSFQYVLLDDPQPESRRIPITLSRRSNCALGTITIDVFIPSDGYTPRLLPLGDPEAGGDAHRALAEWFSLRA